MQIRHYYLAVFLLSLFDKPLFAQESDTASNLGIYFDRAYKENPSIPRGILEAIAFSNTGIHHITHQHGESGSCTGMPKVYGVMGLMEDGRNVFRNNLQTIARYSDLPMEKIKLDTFTNILAFARAYAHLQRDQLSFIAKENIEAQSAIISALSELPANESFAEDSTANYSLDYHLYTVYTFLNDVRKQKIYKFNSYKISFDSVFKNDRRLRLLRAPFITIGADRGLAGVTESADYGPADWVPAAACNYSKGRPGKVTAIVIHDMEGSYGGCISWFKACPCKKEQCGHCPAGTRKCEDGEPTGSSSAHYLISNLGQVTQMVREADNAYHARSANGYTIGIEHEGYCSNRSYPEQLYQASARLVKDICTRYSIDRRTTFNGQGCPCDAEGKCEKPATFLVKGHQMYPAQTHTDPGPNWNWLHYFELINK